MVRCGFLQGPGSGGLRLPERKTRALFVISHLAQGGAERFAYEVLKTIDKTKFDVALLTKRHIRGGREGDYYYWKIAELGIPIYRKLPIFLRYLRRHVRPLFLPLRGFIETLHRWVSRLFMGDLLDRFDVINVISIENYYLMQPLLEDNERVMVYLMSQAFQYRENPYLDCRPGRRYRFAICDRTMPADYEQAHCKGAETIHVPLSLDMTGRDDLSNWASIEPPYRIAVFMRLNPREHPISGIFRAFARLRADVDAELWVYGRGNPEQFAAEVDELRVREKVSFRGHTTSIENSLRDHRPAVIWMTCYDTTLGYASIEVASLGFPMLFWNLGKASTAEIARMTNGAIRAYSDPEQLAAATLAAVRDADQLRRSGQQLRAYITAMHDIRRYADLLEKTMEKIAAQHAEQMERR